MNSGKVSCPELIVQVAGILPEGMDYASEVSMEALDLGEDARFDIGGARLSFELHIAPVKSDIVVSGRIAADVLALCDRCAEMTPLRLEDSQVFHRYRNLMGEPIDLTEDIREDILLAFPQSHLCRPDCRGICPSCGQNRNDGSCRCEQTVGALEEDSAFIQEERNPWAALDDIHLDS